MNNNNQNMGNLFSERDSSFNAHPFNSNAEPNSPLRKDKSKILDKKKIMDDFLEKINLGPGQKKVIDFFANANTNNNTGAKAKSLFNSLGSVIFGLIFLSIPLFVAFYIFNDLRDAIESQEWPQTTGIITESELKFNGDDNYSAHLRFDYLVDGVKYSSTLISLFNMDFEEHEDKKKFLEKYPVNSEAKVYYSPENPTKALLIPGPQIGFYVTVGIISLFILLGGAFVLFGAISFAFNLIKLLYSVNAHGFLEDGKQMISGYNGQKLISSKTENSFNSKDSKESKSFSSSYGGFENKFK